MPRRRIAGPKDVHIFNFARSCPVAVCTSLHFPVYTRGPGGAHGVKGRWLPVPHAPGAASPASWWMKTNLLHHNQKMRLLMGRDQSKRMGLWRHQDRGMDLTLPLSSYGSSAHYLSFCICRMEQECLPLRGNVRMW